MENRMIVDVTSSSDVDFWKNGMSLSSFVVIVAFWADTYLSCPLRGIA